MKKAMTKTMTQALTIPTFTFSDDMNATSLLQLRKDAKAHIDGLTLLPFFIKALSLAMLEFPIVNSIVNPEKDSEGLIKEYIIKKDHNFAIAIDSKEGLTTPNIKNVNLKTIKQINQDLKDLQYRSENNKLVKSDFEESTFSVSSVGNIGGRYFVPTILSPQTAIIAIGKSQKVPKYIHSNDTDLKH
jgi:2-oxoisovalerate dehydrogenase E2 component (dihydrolipoyl transacylase)